MMEEQALYSLRNPWMRWSVLSVLVIVAVSVFVGFVWLPAGQNDFGAQGLWASICRAAGVPGDWGGNQGPDRVGVRTTSVVLDRGMARAGGSESVGRGATLALQCSICHGAKGLSGTDAPNLAGQYPEVIIKQLADYRRGDRISAIMQALAQGLSDADVHDVAAYYAYLPKVVNVGAEANAAAPALVRVGDPMRNVAPCASCHGGIDHKLGAPWLEGLPVEYVQAQLEGFRSGERKNDSSSQMRNMARTLSNAEIAAIARFYAGGAPAR
jgi:cytochrome c553